MTLADEFFGAERHCHVGYSQIPLLPCATVEPNVALFCPVIVLDLFEGTQHSLDADTVCAMRVGKVAGCVYLMWTYLAHQFLYNLNIIVAQLSLLYTAGLIEWQVEEVGICAVIKAY